MQIKSKIRDSSSSFFFIHPNQLACIQRKGKHIKEDKASLLEAFNYTLSFLCAQR